MEPTILIINQNAGDLNRGRHKKSRHISMVPAIERWYQTLFLNHDLVDDAIGAVDQFNHIESAVKTAQVKYPCV